jgi:hypothetical protein
MTQKFLYIVDHFCDFPTSEYGGIWNVIAENSDECFDLIVKHDEGFNQKYYVNLREKVLKARTFSLVEQEESRVVEAFTT